MFMTPRLWN